MFPLSQTAIAALTLSAPFLAGAATGVLRRRWTTLLLVAAAVPLYFAFLREMLGSEDIYVRRLGAPLIGVLFLAAWLLGELWGWIVRIGRQLLPMKLVVAAGICALPAFVFSAWRVERQFVPESCLQGITVAIRSAEYRVRPDQRARLAWQPGETGAALLSYTQDRTHKDETAQLCRKSGNGSVPLAPQEVVLGMPGARTTSCQGDRPCITSDTSEFRIETVDESEPRPPSSWFGDKTRGDIRWSGTASDGWICFLPNGALTWMSCQRWQTPAPGVRVTASADLTSGETPDFAVRALEDGIASWLERLTP